MTKRKSLYLGHRVPATVISHAVLWYFVQMFVSLRGGPYPQWRAVDEHGTELDILLQKRRDKAAAKRFFTHVLRSNPVSRKLVTNQLRRSSARAAPVDFF